MSSTVSQSLRAMWHYGSLGIFFALYISLCYAITFYFLAGSPQSSPLEAPGLAPASSQATVAISDVTSPLIDITSKATPEQSVSQGIEAKTASSQPSTPDTPIKTPQDPIVISPTPSDPASPTLVKQVSKPVLQLLNDQQAFLKKLVGSL